MQLDINISNNIRFPTAGLNDNIIETIARDLTLQNPKYIDAVKHNRYLGKINPEIYYYSRKRHEMTLPRGYINHLLKCLNYHRIAYKIIDNTRSLPEVEFTFKGRLYPYQQQALDAILGRRYGTLDLPTGAGKTTLGLAVIAQRRQPALVVVHNGELLRQWIARATQFLDLDPAEIGVIGNGKKIIGPRLTVAIINSLHPIASDIKHHFGHLVIDECHRTASETFIRGVSALDARFMLGLSATLYRRDTLTKVISFYLGDPVYKILPKTLQDAGYIMPGILKVRPTSFTYPDASEDYQGCISALVEDEARNQLIASDVAGQIGKGISLVLSDRVAHCQDIHGRLLDRGIDTRLLTGDMPDRERKAIVAELHDGHVKALVSTCALCGEGFDLKSLGSIFLTTPVKFSGRTKQYIGRILRTADGKQTPTVYDYVDDVGILQAAHRSRLKVYQEMGVIL